MIMSVPKITMTRCPMNHDVVILVDACIRLKNELGLLTPIIVHLDPSWGPGRNGREKVTPLARKRFREKWNQLGRVQRIKEEYIRQEKDLKGKLSDLAELLEEEEFNVEKFRRGLTQAQYLWLHSKKGEIKRHLRGVVVGLKSSSKG
jgi:hypothetical protein